ncbi:MAG TPA: oligosaccharyl transferase, archaeosortase A system-associated [Methanomicrobia archaeon]|nr:oligosaccharyl transferase, archaeosortase A system-associated [Methanomicrobia archaeon]
MELPQIQVKRIDKLSLIYGVAVALLVAVSLYIRVALPYDSVLGGAFVRFGGNDPWYHMRIVDNTLHNFPHRIYYDAYTYYPYGTTKGFAPLFGYLLAAIIWIIGRGNPYATLGQDSIDVIGAWYPAVLGALTVIPVYFIGKAVWNRNAGLLAAALIAILPGQFLSRSIVGFTDHHVMETLLSTTALLFFILALKAAKNNEITYYSLLEKDWTALKRPISYSLLAGIFLGSLQLAWIGAPLIMFVLIVYAIVQYIIDHLRGASTDYLCIVSIPAFIIALLMLAPIPKFGALTGIQMISIFLAIAVVLALGAVSFVLNAKKIVPYVFPIVVVLLAVVSLVLLNALAPALYANVIGALHVFVPSESSLTIAEVHPMHIFSQYTGKIVDGEAWRWFSTTFFIAFAGFILLGYNIAKQFRAEEVLVLVWSGIMLFACFGQNRFAAHYAINVALLCGLVCGAIIDYVWSRGKPSRTGKAATKGGKVKGKMKLNAKGGATEKSKTKTTAAEPENRLKVNTGKISATVRPELILAILAIGLIVFYPPLTTTLASARSGGGPDDNWYKALTWMKANTPEPGLDYYGLYEEPPFNETTNERGVYDYPEPAYSVISWWDYGHWITRIGHRIPVANPLGQDGIGGPYRDNAPGASVFFIANNEPDANEIADALDVKYVVSDFMMADVWNSYYNKYGAMTVWAGDPQRYSSLGYYYYTMVARLHMFDGTRTNVDGTIFPALHHYRLVHESPTFFLPILFMDTNTGYMNWRSYSNDYTTTAAQAQILHGHLFEFPAGTWIEDDLNNNTLPELLVSAFTSSGIPFSEQSTVSKMDEGRWMIRDVTNNNVFIIARTEEGMLRVNLYGVGTGQENLKAWTPEYLNPVGFVKVFEYVPGAHITGTAANGSVIEISTAITTNQGRRFTYALETTASPTNTYEFIVPYSTDGPIAGGTQFDLSVTPYTLRAGHYENGTLIWDTEQEVHVSETDVLNRGTITIDLL